MVVFELRLREYIHHIFMATGSMQATYQFVVSNSLTRKPNSKAVCFPVYLTRETMLQGKVSHVLRKKNSLNIRMVMQQRKNESENYEANMISNINTALETPDNYNNVDRLSRAEERLGRKKLERKTYLLAAMLSSLGISSMAIMAVYYRFSWQMEVLILFCVFPFFFFFLS